MTDSQKSAKQQAKQAWEALKAAGAGGDYRKVRELANVILQTSPDSEFGQKAREQQNSLKVDAMALYVLAGTAAVWILAWLLSL